MRLSQVGNRMEEYRAFTYSENGLATVELRVDP